MAAKKKGAKKTTSRAASTPYIDREIVSNNGQANWETLHSALLAGTSVELISVLIPQAGTVPRVTMVARIWLDHRADGSNDPERTPPNPPIV